MATIKNSAAVKTLSKNKDKIMRSGCGMILRNFQKDKGQIFTSSRTSVEIDFEVSFEVQYHKSTIICSSSMQLMRPVIMSFT